jgi:D-ribose pyranose/furanose isomerase RbsD
MRKSGILNQEILKATGFVGTYGSSRGLRRWAADPARHRRLTRDAKAIIRTGEFTPFANAILQSGVDFS